jgi:hypothetical protein
LVRRRQVVRRRPSVGRHETLDSLVVVLRLERRHQHPLLGIGHRDFLVGGELEVVKVVVVEVHVLLPGAAGAGALRPQFLSKFQK